MPIEDLMVYYARFGVIDAISDDKLYALSNITFVTRYKLSPKVRLDIDLGLYSSQYTSHTYEKFYRNVRAEHCTMTIAPINKDGKSVFYSDDECQNIDASDITMSNSNNIKVVLSAAVGVISNPVTGEINMEYLLASLSTNRHFTRIVKDATDATDATDAKDVTDVKDVPDGFNATIWSNNISARCHINSTIASYAASYYLLRFDLPFTVQPVPLSSNRPNSRLLNNIYFSLHDEVVPHQYMLSYYTYYFSHIIFNYSTAPYLPEYDNMKCIFSQPDSPEPAYMENIMHRKSIVYAD